MNPTLNVLPHCALDLRPVRGDGLPVLERSWLLCSRDDRARPMWEVVLSTPALHALLECLAEGQATANAGNLQIRIYPDADLERSVRIWANRQLTRYAGGLTRPQLVPCGRGIERSHGTVARLA